jgi:hypothetical protein
MYIWTGYCVSHYIILVVDPAGPLRTSCVRTRRNKGRGRCRSKRFLGTVYHIDSRSRLGVFIVFFYWWLFDPVNVAGVLAMPALCTRCGGDASNSCGQESLDSVAGWTWCRRTCRYPEDGGRDYYCLCNSVHVVCQAAGHVEDHFCQTWSLLIALEFSQRKPAKALDNTGKEFVFCLSGPGLSHILQFLRKILSIDTIAEGLYYEIYHRTHRTDGQRHYGAYIHSFYR